jgi:hypothetical protein
MAKHTKHHPAKHTKHHPAKHTKHHPPPRRRNADGIPDDVLLPLAPVQPSFLRPPATQPPLPYPYPYPPPRRRPSRPRRAAAAVAKKAGELADAIKPEAATINKEHLMGVGANAVGGVGAALLANELVDNVGVMPMAIGTTVVGALGATFLKGNWQKAMQGMLGAGVGQLGVAYLTERALKKAANAEKQAATNAPAKPAPEAGKRNAYLGGVDDDTMIRAMDRTERKIHTLLAEEDARNAYGDAGIDGDAWDYGYAA